MFVSDVSGLQFFARKFAGRLHAPQVVALHGDLGVGKTEFARAIVQELKGCSTVVPSPTFTLVQEYDDISHFDLYRLKNISELDEIGFFDAIQENIVLIEWPEIAEKFLPKNTVHVYISVSGNGREIDIK